MPAKSAAKDKLPQFKFESKYNSDDFLSVRVIRSKEDSYGVPLGAICKREYSGKQPCWVWHETFPSEAKEYVERIQFPDKELAANFLNSLLERSEKYCTERPLPSDVVQYLESRAKALNDEQVELRRRFLDVLCEKARLLEFAEKNKIDRVEYLTDDSDSAKKIRRLLDFEVSIQEKGAKKDEWESIPFVSERVLYHLIGKEDARSVLVYLRDIIDLLDPVLAREI